MATISVFCAAFPSPGAPGLSPPWVQHPPSTRCSHLRSSSAPGAARVSHSRWGCVPVLAAFAGFPGCLCSELSPGCCSPVLAMPSSSHSHLPLVFCIKLTCTGFCVSLFSFQHIKYNHKCLCTLLYSIFFPLLLFTGEVQNATSDLPSFSCSFSGEA